MSEQTSGTEEQATTGGERGRTSAGLARRDSQSAPLESERGRTSIADAVVTKVASIAAREVSGVYSLGSGTTRAIGSVAQRVGIGDERTQGVSVEVGEREAAVDIVMVIEYGESIPRVSEAVRENVIRRIEGICGLSVAEVNVEINDLYFPGDDVDEPSRVQ